MTRLSNATLAQVPAALRPRRDTGVGSIIVTSVPGVPGLKA